MQNEICDVWIELAHFVCIRNTFACHCMLNEHILYPAHKDKNQCTKQTRKIRTSRAHILFVLYVSVCVYICRAAFDDCCFCFWRWNQSGSDVILHMYSRWVFYRFDSFLFPYVTAAIVWNASNSLMFQRFKWFEYKQKQSRVPFRSHFYKHIKQKLSCCVSVRVSIMCRYAFECAYIFNSFVGGCCVCCFAISFKLDTVSIRIVNIYDTSNWDLLIIWRVNL